MGKEKGEKAAGGKRWGEKEKGENGGKGEKGGRQKRGVREKRGGKAEKGGEGRMRRGKGEGEGVGRERGEKKKKERRGEEKQGSRGAQELQEEKGESRAGTRFAGARASPAPHLVVLVGGDGDEGCLREDVGAEGRVLGAKAVVLVRFHDVEPGLVFVHGVQDDLGEGRRRGYPVGMEGAQRGESPPTARGEEEEEERGLQLLPPPSAKSSPFSGLPQKG